MLRSRPALVAALVAILALSGCAPEAEPEPLFSSDAEALAAAVEVYEEYLAVSNAVSNAGGVGEEALHIVATGEALVAGLEGAREYRDLSERSTGGVLLADAHLVDYEPSPPSVKLSACVDYSQLDVVDSFGNSTVSSDRQDYLYFDVEIVWNSNSGKVGINQFSGSGSSCE